MQPSVESLEKIAVQIADLSGLTKYILLAHDDELVWFNMSSPYGVPVFPADMYLQFCSTAYYLFNVPVAQLF